MMRVNLYPALCRHFKTMQELADAGCMSRTRAYQCLYGIKNFTDQEKRAIWNAILVKVYDIDAIKWDGRVLTDFDDTFKRRQINL